MFAAVWFAVGDREPVMLLPGDFIGRSPYAALHLNDARVSEAHAMVSFRGGQLKLLALRGRFEVSGRVQTELTLEPGVRLALAKDLCLRVESVDLPDSVLGLGGDQLAAQALANVCSLLLGPPPTLEPRYRGGAAVHIWSGADGWQMQLEGQAARALQDGDRFAVGGREFWAQLIPLSASAMDETRLKGKVGPTLHLVANYDTFHIHRADEDTAVITGISARILSELLALGTPTEWETIASEIWAGESERAHLRRRWDVAIARLRRKLRRARLRADLVRADGSGRYELVLNTGDTTSDRT